MTTRRGFLAGILAAGFAPAAIGSGVLMPVRRIATLELEIGRWEGFRFIESPMMACTVDDLRRKAKLMLARDRLRELLLPEDDYTWMRCQPTY